MSFRQAETPTVATGAGPGGHPAGTLSKPAVLLRRELTARDDTLARAPYSGLARIATRSTDFFRIPPDRVIELGAEVEI